jgi:hypothetical protein
MGWAGDIMGSFRDIIGCSFGIIFLFSREKGEVIAVPFTSTKP